MKKPLIALCTALMCILALVPMGCGEQRGEPEPTVETEYFTYTYNKMLSGYQVKATEAAKTQTELTVPDKVDGWPVVAIIDYGFIRLSNLEKITVSENLIHIGSSAFANCTSLTSVTLPEAVNVIKDSAFSGCTALSSVTLPTTVRQFGKGIFSGCTNLTTANLPSGLKTIPDKTFQGCNLSSVTIPDTVTSIGTYAFASNTGLSSVTLHKSISLIDDYAFYGCSSLTEILFPKGAALHLGDYAFATSGLEKVYLPEDVTLGTYVFQKLRWDEAASSSSCKGIYYESPNGDRGINAFGYTWDEESVKAGFRIYIPEGSMSYYKTENDGDEAWARCVVNVSWTVLEEYSVSEVFPGGFPCLQ